MHKPPARKHPGKAGDASRQPTRPDPRPDPRAGARALLAAVRDGVDIDTAEARLDLPPPERARARRLALATLRHRGRAEAVLAPLLHRRPRPAVLEALHLAVTEMLALGEAPHGVVNATVTALRQGPQKHAAAAGMANAVLRKAALAQAAWDQAAPARLPDWLRKPVGQTWGEAAARAIEAAHEAGAPIDLTSRPGATTLPEATTLPSGSLRLTGPAHVSALPGYDEGAWWVQDAAAALPARLLDPQPDERIADLCAAPGGKTLQLAAAGAQVTAIDIAAARMRRLAENLARCNLTAETVTADALAWRPEAPLDAVLLDAPCSATGTIRRHPELPLLRDGSGMADLTALQARLLDHALSLLRPGGRLVYATCSLLPAEGEDQLAAALTRHPGLAIIPADAARLGIPPDWLTREGAIRTRPDFWADRGGVDGFFIACLRRE